MKVCIVGMGYIGLPTAVSLSRGGHDVVGVDVRADVLSSLREGRVHIEEPGIQEALTAALAHGMEFAEEPVPADAYIICVPSPVRADKSVDLTYIEAASRAVASVATPGELVVLESTVPVNTTRDVVAAAVKAGVLVAHCPETILPGNMLHEIQHNSRVIGGLNDEATAAAVALYQTFCEGPIHTTDASAAEFIKLAQNAFRDVNIAFANDLNQIARSHGVDLRAAIPIANQHPRVNIHWPGPGVGGHCIPVDPWFLIGPGDDSILRKARAVNDAVPAHLARYVSGLLPPDARIGVLGLAYKANVDDVRESPSFDLVEALESLGHEVVCHDPHGKHDRNEALDDCLDTDALVFVVAHDAYRGLKPDEVRTQSTAGIVIDACGALETQEWSQAGFQCHLW